MELSRAEKKLKDLIEVKITNLIKEIDKMEKAEEINKVLSSELSYYLTKGFSIIEDESLDFYWNYIKNFRAIILSQSPLDLKEFNKMILLDYVEYIEYKLLKHFKKIKKVFNKI